jgi:ankyrin repeat protein
MLSLITNTTYEDINSLPQPVKTELSKKYLSEIIYSTKTVKDTSWSKYSWSEIAKISLYSAKALLSENLNLLYIGLLSGDLKLIKKILEVENIEINAAIDQGKTALHIASLDGNLELVKFLVSQGADINVATPKTEHDSIVYNEDNNTLSTGTVISGGGPIIELSVSKLDLEMTKYFLKLGMKLPQVNTVILKDSANPKTGKEFLEELIEYYQNKCLEDSKY